jgi:flagella basal body P-ring formation protein FlgA
MEISLKVEILEDGAKGQQVRVRNPQSKREFRGKVENENTITIGM